MLKTHIKQAAVFVAAVAMGVSALGGAAVVSAKASPALVESVKAPISPQDACACGGAVTVTGWYEYCSSPDFISRITWYSNGSSSLVTWFEPVRC